MDIHTANVANELLDGVDGDMQNVYVSILPPVSEQSTDCHEICSPLTELLVRYATAEDQLAWRIDTEKYRLQKSVISRIGCAINARSAVSRLPTEILGAILGLVRADWPLRLTYPKSDNPALGCDPKLDLAWIKISHVSKQWRAVALAFHGLWSQIDPYTLGTQWLNVMLARSMGAPLTLHESYELTEYVGNELLSSVMARTRSLNLSEFRSPLSYGPYIEFTEDVLETFLAPGLEELVLRAANPFRRAEDEPDDEEDEGFFNLPATIFNSSATRLRTITLENIIPCWTSPLWSSENIRSLSISFVNAYRGGRDELQQTVDMSPNEFLAALSILAPRLEDLTLVNCLPLIEKWNEIECQRAIFFPSLKELNISCDSLDVLFAFTGYLTVTGTVRWLDIEVDSLGDSAITQSDAQINGVYTRFLTLVKSLCFLAPGSDVGDHQELRGLSDGLSIHMIPDPRFDSGDDDNIVGAQPFLSLQLMSASTLPPHHEPTLITITMPLDLPMTCPTFTLHLIEMFPISWVGLKSLSLIKFATGYDGEPDRAVWSIEQVQKLAARLGGRKSELTTLHCGGGFASAITYALHSSDPLSVFPGLHRLVLEDAFELNLKRTVTEWMSDPRPHWPRAGSEDSGLSSLFKMVYEMLKFRHEHDGAITSLQLKPSLLGEGALPDMTKDDEDEERGISEVNSWKNAFRELEREIEDYVEEAKFSFCES